jgi:hypothetical protein
MGEIFPLVLTPVNHVAYTFFPKKYAIKLPPPPCPPPSRGRVWEGVKNGISYTIKVFGMIDTTKDP